MNRKIILLIGGIIFFLIIYLGISYSLFNAAVDDQEKHLIKQTRIALREASDRMATFLTEQSDSLKMLALFHRVQTGIDINDFSFIEKISFMELTTADIFIVINSAGKCVMAKPEGYTDLFLGQNFSGYKFFKMTRESKNCFMSKAVPIKDRPQDQRLFFIFAFIPVYGPNASFEGIIGLGFKVEKLFHKYFKLLETNYDGSTACVTDTAGNIEVFKNNSVIKKNSSHIKPTILPPIPQELVDEQYHGSYVWDTPDDEKNLIIYHPINVEKNTWIAQLKIPYSTIDQALLPFYWKLFVSLIVLISIAAFGIVVSITANRQIARLKKQINELEIQIDEKKKKAEVEEITGSDFFRDLLKQAEKLKKE